MITANRTLLAALVASNIVGQNTAAIADTEAQYADYWAQDAAAMSAYSVSSAAATQLPRFAPATNSTNESGVSAQKAAVTAANSNAAANKAVTQSYSPLSTQQTGDTYNYYGDIYDLSDTTAAAGGKPFFAALDAIQGTGVGFSAPYNMEQFVSGIIGAENNLGILAKPLAAAPALAAPALSSTTTSLGGVSAQAWATSPQPSRTPDRSGRCPCPQAGPRPRAPISRRWSRPVSPRCREPRSR